MRFALDDTRWLSIGGGLRATFNSVEDAAPSGGDSDDFELDNFRLYFNGQVHRLVAFQVNTERDRIEDEIRLLDGIIKLGFNDALNLWVGRHKLASDRGNLNSVFNIIPWDRVAIRRFPNEFAGRDDGATLWGHLGDHRVKYYAQVFGGAPDDDDDLLLTGRILYNFFDPEIGFTNAGSYLGTKHVLAVGASALTESGKNAWTLDAFYERNFGPTGVVTLDGAYFSYHGLADSKNLAVDGDAYYLEAAYRLPQEILVGYIQPFIRYQDADLDNTNGNRLDIGVNYLINGFDALLTFMWARDDELGSRGDNIDIFRIGTQIQF